MNNQLLRADFAATVLIATTCAAQAETCEEKFIRMMSDCTANESTKILLTQQLKGA